MKARKSRSLFFLAGVLSMSPAFALSLQEAWEGAQSADKEFAAAFADSEAGGTRRDQASRMIAT